MTALTKPGAGKTCACCGQVLPPPPEAFPWHRTCHACGTPVLVFRSNRTGVPCLIYDPYPGEGDYYDTVLSEDGTRISGSGKATAIDCRGRFPLYRAHYYSCPNRAAW